METQSHELTLEIERVLPSPPPIVFAAFTDPDELAEWWGPAGFTIPSLEYRPRVGEVYRIQMRPPDGEPFFLRGEFEEVDPPSRLAYTFVWEDPDPDDVETLVALTFQDLGGSTEAALTQGPFRTEARRALHRDGWSESFEKLQRHLESHA
jgi:uncharacterized protein YndB with AHSA1/START domain